MIHTLKNQFFQVFSLTIVWVTLLISLFSHQTTVSLTFVWRILAVALISGLLFGVIYNSLWNYLTLPASLNIIISSSLNLLGGMTAVWLISPAMFQIIFPWTLGMLLLSLIGHVIGFYLYAKRQNDQEVSRLNHLIK